MAHRIPALLKFALSVLVLLSPLAAGAADQEIAVLRVSSVDAVLGDLERLATALGIPLDQDELLDSALSPLQYSGTAPFDRSRPAAMIFPTRGLVLGVGALAGVLPVSDPEAALLAIEERFETHGVNGSIHTFARSGGTNLIVRVEEGYLVVGVDETVVGGIDLAAALGSGDLPAGNLSLEIFLEEVAPVLQAGLLQGRQMLEMQMEAAADAQPEESAAEPEQAEPGDGNSGETPSEPDEGEAADVEVTVEPEFDPQAMAPVMDLYFDFLSDAINNLSRVQISFEVSDQHILFHNRVLPLAGSTLDGLIEAQSGGFPDLARLVDPSGAFVVTAGQVTRTPEFEAALAGYAARYLEAVGSLLAGVPDQPLADQYLAMMDSMLPLFDEAMRCYRGDVAAAVGSGPEGGLAVTQVMGVGDAEACRSVLAKAVELVNAIPAGPDGERFATVTENVLQLPGVSANRQEIRMPPSIFTGTEEEEEEVAEFLRTFLGGDRITGYWGLGKDVLISTMGLEAEQSFKDVVDRGAGAKTGVALDASFFEPLETGPGVYAMLDLGALIEMIATLAEDEEDLAELEDFAARSGRLVYGARFGAADLQFDVALPMETLAAWAEVLREAAAEEELEDEQEDEFEDEPSPGDVTPEISLETTG